MPSNLDHNLLMHLALGVECRVYDYGSRGNYWEYEDGTTEQLWVPRAVWWGLEWSRYALEAVWHVESGEGEDTGAGEASAGEGPDVAGSSARVRTPLLRGYNVRSLFDEKLRGLPKPLWKKLKYYRAYLAPGLDELRLHGYYAGTELDGNKEAYKSFLRDHADRCADAAAPPLPSEEEVPLAFYDARTMMRVGFQSGSSPPPPSGAETPPP